MYVYVYIYNIYIYIYIYIYIFISPVRVDKRKIILQKIIYRYAQFNNKKNEIYSVHAKLNKFILIPNEIETTAWIAAYSLSYPLLNHT